MSLSREKIALHEAAHGIVWYLFKENWNVNTLSIERTGLPDDRMNGTLHITPNFDENQNTLERVNEVFAISLAGLIGQNIDVLMQRDDLLIELMTAPHYNQILDETGCGGDYEIARQYLSLLGDSFQTTQQQFTKYKILDLVSIFQDHTKVQQIHARLSSILLERGTLSGEELVNFFEVEKFQDYIEEENLDINFFHQR
jgi:hypothetical protein